MAAGAPSRVTNGGKVNNGKKGQPIHRQQHYMSAPTELQDGPQHGRSGIDGGNNSRGRGDQKQEHLRPPAQLGGEGGAGGAYRRRRGAATAGQGSNDGIRRGIGNGCSSNGNGRGGGGGGPGGKARRLVATSAAFLVSGVAHELILL